MMWQYTRRETKLLLLATLLVFSGYGLILSQSWQEARVGAQRENQMASPVGVLAAVPENEVSALAQQLTEREEELTAREAALVRAEGRADTKTLTIVTLVGAGLLGLILMNFYLDMRRRHSLA